MRCSVRLHGLHADGRDSPLPALEPAPNRPEHGRGKAAAPTAMTRSESSTAGPCGCMGERDHVSGEA